MLTFAHQKKSYEKYKKYFYTNIWKTFFVVFKDYKKVFLELFSIVTFTWILTNNNTLKNVLKKSSLMQF